MNASRLSAGRFLHYVAGAVVLAAFSFSLQSPLLAKELPRAKAEAVGMSSERLARLAEALDGYAEEGRLAGGVVLVARRGEVVLHHAFGHRDVEADDPMERGDIFRIASQSKALVSTAILILQEDGEVLIGDPLHKYLPAFADMQVAVGRAGGGYDLVPAKRAITLRDLLTHTSGLSYGGGVAADRWGAAEMQGWYFAHRDEGVVETVNRMAELPLESHPGEKFVYGYSTDVLGAVVEVASGMPLDDFLRERIFEPLGMTDTFFYVPEAKRDRLATVYYADEGKIGRSPDEGTMLSQGHYVVGPRKSFSGGAGLLSTASDYARFLQAMANGGTLDGHRLLAPSTVRLMTTNHIGDKFVWGAGTGFGLGFSVLTDLGARGTPGSVGEFAWGGAYHSSYWVDPREELVVVYLTQIIPAGDIDDHGKVRALVYAAIEE